MSMTINRKQDGDLAKLAAGLVGFSLDKPADLILTDGRGPADAAFARQVAMYAVYVSFGVSLARVAAAFGRDRSTVAHACHLVEDRRDDPVLDAWLDHLDRTLKEAAKLSSPAWSAR